MRNIVLKLSELEEIFWTITMLMLGLDPESEDEKETSRVRLTWPTLGAPAWEIDDDVCFLSITPRDDLINRQRSVKYEDMDESLKKITEYTEVVNCSYILYGPNSYDDARNILNLLFHPDYKEMFDNHCIYLIPDIASPIRSPELFNGQWWERNSFEVNFNLYVRREEIVNHIEEVEITFTNKDFSTERRIKNGGIEP